VAVDSQQLQQRLIDFAFASTVAASRLPRDYTCRHVAQQLARSGSSPSGNYAEARSAESPRDFLHKMQLCLKQLREAQSWIAVAVRLRPGAIPPEMSGECNELTAIFQASVTATRRSIARRRKRPRIRNRPAHDSPDASGENKE
jgi:four helix bundle protein